MKRLVIAAVLIAAIGFSLAAPAAAQGMDGCPHSTTIGALHECVAHAEQVGHIDNVGISRSLHAKLNAADTALANGDVGAAVNALAAFIHELDAQAAKHVETLPAVHLALHARMVIDALTT